jgi:hypothetical protein
MKLRHNGSCPIRCPACGPDDEIIICYGNAKPEDTHLASTIHCINAEIFKWLERRERKKRRLSNARSS